MKTLLEQSQALQTLFKRSQIELVACQILLICETLQKASEFSPKLNLTLQHEEGVLRDIKLVEIKPSILQGSHSWFSKEHLQELLQNLNVNVSLQSDTFPNTLTEALVYLYASPFTEMCHTTSTHCLTILTNRDAIDWVTKKLCEELNLDISVIESIKAERLARQMNEIIPLATPHQSKKMML